MSSLEMKQFLYSMIFFRIFQYSYFEVVSLKIVKRSFWSNQVLIIAQITWTKVRI